MVFLKISQNQADADKSQGKCRPSHVEGHLGKATLPSANIAAGSIHGNHAGIEGAHVPAPSIRCVKEAHEWLEAPYQVAVRTNRSHLSVELGW
jgi:hypothetical protein